VKKWEYLATYGNLTTPTPQHYSRPLSLSPCLCLQFGLYRHHPLILVVHHKSRHHEVLHRPWTLHSEVSRLHQYHYHPVPGVKTRHRSAVRSRAAFWAATQSQKKWCDGGGVDVTFLSSHPLKHTFARVLSSCQCAGVSCCAVGAGQVTRRHSSPRKAEIMRLRRWRGSVSRDELGQGEPCLWCDILDHVEHVLVGDLSHAPPHDGACPAAGGGLRSRHTSLTRDTSHHCNHTYHINTQHPVSPTPRAQHQEQEKENQLRG
jgi:hypothetical protein